MAKDGKPPTLADMYRAEGHGFATDAEEQAYLAIDALLVRMLIDNNALNANPQRDAFEGATDAVWAALARKWRRAGFTVDDSAATVFYVRRNP